MIEEQLDVLNISGKKINLNQALNSRSRIQNHYTIQIQVPDSLKLLSGRRSASGCNYRKLEVQASIPG